MTDILYLSIRCNKCKREIPDDGIYYKHPIHGFVCEYCPEFNDGDLKIIDKENDDE